ncbi:MAG: hypothetical protein MJ172_11050 [Clostridia bacterium]|nr:hypothetical protein [Clostridia bacterium]
MSLLKKNAPVIDKPSVGKTVNLKVFAFRKTVGLLLLTFTFSILCSCSSTVSEQKGSKGKKDSSKKETTTEDVSIVSDITDIIADDQEVPEKGSVTYISREDFKEALTVCSLDEGEGQLGTMWEGMPTDEPGSMGPSNCTYMIFCRRDFFKGFVDYYEFADAQSAQDFFYRYDIMNSCAINFLKGRLGKGEFNFSESVASMIFDVSENPMDNPMYGGIYLYENIVILAYVRYECDEKETIDLFLDTINYPCPADIEVSVFDDDSIPSLGDSGFSNALQQIDLENAIVRTGDSSEFILQANRQNEDFLYHQYEDREWANENYADILEFYCGGIILHQFEGSLKFCITDSTISTLVDVIDRDEGKIYYGGYFLYNNIIHYALTYSDDFKERMDVNAYLEAIDYPSP